MSDFDMRVNETVENFIQQQKDYLDEVAEYRENGHRHHYCFHGVNQWVDYDCACGACEDGAINEYSSREEIEEYAKELVESDIEMEKREQDRKDKMIELIMQSKQRYSYLQAEKVFDDLFA